MNTLVELNIDEFGENSFGVNPYNKTEALSTQNLIGLICKFLFGFG